MAKCIDSGADHVFDIVFFRSIGCYKYGLAAGIADLSSSLFTCICSNVGNYNTCALTREEFCCGLSHTTCGACDNCYFVFESHKIPGLLSTSLSTQR